MKAAVQEGTETRPASEEFNLLSKQASEREEGRGEVTHQVRGFEGGEPATEDGNSENINRK